MSDYDEIKDAVFDYFEGYKTKNRARLERAFAVDIANMMDYWKNPNGELELFSMPMHKLINTWVNPEYQPYELGDGKILAIQIFGDIGATVLFDCGGRFTDTSALFKRHQSRSIDRL